MAQDHDIGRYSTLELLRDLRLLLRPYRWQFWFAACIRITGDLAWLYPAFAFASIVTFLTHYRLGESLRPLWQEIILLLLATILRSVSQLISKSIGYRLAERVSIDASLKAVHHLFRLDMLWHERENSGNKIKRIQNAGDGFNKILRLWFNNLLEISVNLFAINFIIAHFDSLVVLGLSAFLLSYFLISGVMTRRAGEASIAVNIQEEEVNGLLFEAVNNIRTVKVMGMAATFYEMLSKSTAELYSRLGIRIFRYQSRNSFLSFWAGAWKIALMVVIIHGILEQQYEIGFLILFNSYFSDLRSSIDELSTAGIEFVTSKLSIARMRAILNEPILIDDDTGKVPLPSDWKQISLRNVAFSYGENEVLHNISFNIRRGEKVGIVGLSGAGKSTLFKLLLKEREEFSGEIRFDALSLKNISRTDYFKRVSVVLQDTEVFNFSLRDNITFTDPEERDNSVLLNQSLATAHIVDLVRKLPLGLDTLIGEKGIKLSGGERQRLGLARAIFKQPQILLLDEATSHLDLESELKIRESLHDFFENVTAIVIAHRLTTIREMDTIVFIDNGSVAEMGTFEDLHAQRGKFFELWERQKFS